MKEDQLKQILLFFFFVTLNERRSIELSREAWYWCLDRKKKDPNVDPEHLLLLSLEKFWKTLEEEPRTGVSHYSVDSGWMLPKEVRLETWKEFQKTSTNDELFITVITEILKISEASVTQTLGLSPGTIRYRLAKTTRRIGATAGVRS